MFKHAFAILVISAASATSVAAHADWSNGATRYAPPRHVVAPRYCPPNRPVPTAYYWAPVPHYAPYRYAPYAYAPSNHGWRKVWRQQRFNTYGPGHGWDNGHDWNDHDGHNWNSGPNHDHDWHNH